VVEVRFTEEVNEVEKKKKRNSARNVESQKGIGAVEQKKSKPPQER